MASLPPLRPGARQLAALAEAVPRLEAHVARERTAAKDAATFAARLAKTIQVGAKLPAPMGTGDLSALMEARPT